ncbi:MAG: class I SAM-dependent methyltransferase [Firmicutes bacterium]|nr:class I SAM-dependent methyltransferase [Bacillota bacterium]
MDERQYTEQTIEYFDNLASIWDSISIHDEKQLRLLIALAAIKPGSRILDIGCGCGVMIGPLLETNPQELLAMDISPRMIEQAKLKYQDARLRLLNEDFYNLKENNFDFALAYSVYPHFPHKKRLAQQTASCLAQGGRFMVAHSESREKINSRHQNNAVAHLSQPLKEAKAETIYWQEYFNIDILIDTQQLYVISGLCR